MLTAIFFVTALICYAALIVTYKPHAKYKKGMLFAVTLPAHVMDHPGIQSIQARFNRQFKQASLWTMVFLIPFVLLHTWFAYQTIYFFVWLSVFFFVMVIPFRHAFRDTLALKRENEWYVGTKRVIQSDLRVARLKNQRMASLWLFLIPFTMSIGLLLWVSSDNKDLLGVVSGGLAITVIFMLVSLYMRRTKAKVYSMNSEVNVSINQASRRSLSFLWLFMAIIENVHFLFLYLLLVNEKAAMSGVWLTIVLVFTVVPIALVLYVYRRNNALEQEVLAQDGKTIYTDDDEYWANGFTYHNPDDKSIFVTKRVGIGETINTGTLVGKLIVWGSVGLTAVFLIVVSFMLVRSELTSPILTITPEHRIEINYPMYSVDFDLADIEQLTLVEDVPSGIKTNGEATDKYARGHFRLKELGKTRLYVFKNNPPYIYMKVEDTNIFYNDKDPLQTKQLFEQLQKQVESIPNP
ncbi:DUF5808 domain-containing protein [Paenibacillus mendelii]|uniref:DUF5808 domain-containing protein n=1 Tax=Paenibacillus mendelii TaxID=206163 RepID=A0ABV6JL34_9BACL|nr:DUF5808 domain-containing protein [Paenibacillus mendelii]MCQ6562355.1 DUF5808 domain-containing protein [Paenibacillus mendelii]